jgi:hypothetical protein
MYRVSFNDRRLIEQKELAYLGRAIGRDERNQELQRALSMDVMSSLNMEQAG